MIAATRPDQKSGKLLTVDAAGGMHHLQRGQLGELLNPGDLVVANDAATLPASLHGQHERTGEPVEIRLAAFIEAGDPTRFVAVAFGAGDFRTLTEDRALPPTFSPGDRLLLGPLVATIERLLDHARLLQVRFDGEAAEVFAGLAHHGRPIQYAHVPTPLALWDVWTNLASQPFAFESPSAGYAVDWHTLETWRRRGVQVATLTHAAGISSTGDPELDKRLPFDEPYIIPKATADAIQRTRATGETITAIGTTVVRALESAAIDSGLVTPGPGIAHGRIGPTTKLQVVDAVLTGMHEPGESHFELLRAFADDTVLQLAHRTVTEKRYRSHEFGDFMLLEQADAA